MKFTTKQRNFLSCAPEKSWNFSADLFSLLKPVLVFILPVSFNKPCIISHFKIARSAGNFAVLHPTSLVKGL